MPLGFCEKDCEQCGLREEMNCPGCQMGPGHEMYGTCAIASCCRGKKLESCSSCDKKVGCRSLAVKDLLAQQRKTHHAAKQAWVTVMQRRAPLVGKWLWVLFWLMIIQIFVPQNLTYEGFWEVRGLEWIADLLALAAGVVLIVLADEERAYRYPGYIMTGLAAHDLLMHLSSVNGEVPMWAILTGMVVPYVRIFGTYLLFAAHSQLAKDVDDALSGKWLKLRKWNLVCAISIEVCNYILIILPVLISIAIGVFGVVLVVLMILELVYLARMAKLFRNYNRS